MPRPAYSKNVVLMMTQSPAARLIQIVRLWPLSTIITMRARDRNFWIYTAIGSWFCSDLFVLVAWTFSMFMCGSSQYTNSWISIFSGKDSIGPFRGIHYILFAWLALRFCVLSYLSYRSPTFGYRHLLACAAINSFAAWMVRCRSRAFYFDRHTSECRVRVFSREEWLDGRWDGTIQAAWFLLVSYLAR